MGCGAALIGSQVASLRAAGGQRGRVPAGRRQGAGGGLPPGGAGGGERGGGGAGPPAPPGAGAPDAIVLDLGKDVETDLAILARIRSANPRLPVIVLADVCETALAMRSLELGAVDVLNKPADIDHLGNRLRSLVATGQSAPRQKGIPDLIVPASAYQRAYEDEAGRHV